MPLDYDGGDKMNSDVSADALEAAAKAKKNLSYADEWADEEADALAARTQWVPKPADHAAAKSGHVRLHALPWPLCRAGRRRPRSPRHARDARR